MELREISDSIYHGKSTEKKKEMNAVYYESAEFIKNNFPQKYQEMLQEPTSPSSYRHSQYVVHQFVCSSW